MNLLQGKKKSPIPDLKFYIVEALAPNAGIENIKLQHKNCGGGSAKISFAPKEEFVSRQSYSGEILEKSMGIRMPKDLLGILFDGHAEYYIGSEPVLEIKCSCGFFKKILLANGGREALVNLARWKESRPNAIIVESIVFYREKIFFGRMENGKVF